MFSIETSKPVQSKHRIFNLWMDLYKMYVFCVDRKCKMTVIIGHSFNIVPYGKMLEKKFYLKSVIQFKVNIAWMITGKTSAKVMFFCADRKLKMATINGHSFYVGPYGKTLKNYCSETVWMIIGWIFTKVMFLWRLEVQDGQHLRT